MPFFYPVQRFGTFGLCIGVSYNLVHRRYGFDLGERFHRDIEYRIETVREIDRAVFGDFRSIGLGYEEPSARASIEPFGHRFVPAMYGCECTYQPGEEPAARKKPFRRDEILNLEPWDLDRFEKSEPVREVVRQARAVQECYDVDGLVGGFPFNSHYRPLSSLQNLGSVINTAVSTYGEDILIQYVEDPALRQPGRGRARAGPLHPMGRLASPEEMARALVFLAGEEAFFITGADLLVDGGYTAR